MKEKTNQPSPDQPNRRRIIKSATAVGAASLVSFPHIARAQAGNNNTIKVGLIGCGGRGVGALTQALSADDNVKVWALGDVFQGGIDSAKKNTTPFGERAAVPGERQYVGLDAFQKVIDSGVDVVLLTSPPGFRPQHIRAAVDAGKHIFAEKPMAIDMAGIHSVLESVKIAKAKNLSIQHGFCWRAAPQVRQAYEKVHSGDYGKIKSVYGTYLSSPVKPIAPDAKKPAGMGDVEWQLRWWMNFEWLSAGMYVEQCIHTVDKIGWAMGDIEPIAAVGNGGKISRIDSGNIYDHHNVTYEYPGGVFAHVGQRSYRGCHSEVVDRVFMEDGTMQGPGRCSVKNNDGKIVWRSKPAEGENNMYQVEHDEFFAALRSGKFINAGEYMVKSTALGILGREACKTGKRITWKELMASKDDQAPDTLKLEDQFAVAPIPIPGEHKLG